MIKLFTADWCSYCVIFKNSLSETDLDDIEIIDIDREPSVREAYNIRSIPTLIKFDSDGVELERLSGGLSRQAFIDFKNV